VAASPPGTAPPYGRDHAGAAPADYEGMVGAHGGKASWPGAPNFAEQSVAGRAGRPLSALKLGPAAAVARAARAPYDR